MRHDHHRHILRGQILDDAQHLSRQLWIERRGRLIKEQDFRVERQGAGNTHALLLTARKLAGHLVLVTRKSHLCNKLVCAGLRLLARALKHADRCIGDVFHHGIVREQIVVLKHQTKPRARLFRYIALCVHRARTRIRRDGKVAKRERATIERLEQRGTAQQRGLTAARRPDNRHDLATLYLERDILEHLIATKRLARAFDFHHRVSHDNSPASFRRRPAASRPQS